MNRYYNEFLKYLEAEDKQRAVEFVMNILNRGEIDVVSLYEQVLTPSLYNMTCSTDEEKYCIWKEHTRTAIVRTIIECCHPFIIKETNKLATTGKGCKALVFCPGEEYHEIGARMVADFFTLCSYDAMFVGSNTPRVDLVSAIDYIKPDYVAISITNYYNLVTAAKTIGEIRKSQYSGYKIIVGGQAFDKNPDAYKEIGADLLISTFKEIEKLCKGGIL